MHASTYVRNLKVIKLIETGSRRVVAKGEEEAGKEGLFNGYRASVLHHEKVLEIWTTVSLSLAILWCILTNG